MTEQILFSGISPSELSELIIKGVKEEFEKLVKQPQQQTKKEEDKYLSVKEACEFLKCSTTKLWRLRKEKKLNSYKSGRNILFKKNELEEFINQSEKKGGQND